MAATTYIQAVRSMIDRIEETQMNNILEAARIVADSVQNGGMLFGFGTGHSHMIAEEMMSRAGGLIQAQGILETELMVHINETQATYLERLPGLAHVYLTNSPVERAMYWLSSPTPAAMPFLLRWPWRARRWGCTSSP